MKVDLGPGPVEPPPLDRHTRSILWREWRHCEDPAWAEELESALDPPVKDPALAAVAVLVGVVGLVHAVTPDRGADGMPWPVVAVTGLLLGSALGVALKRWRSRGRAGMGWLDVWVPVRPRSDGEMAFLLVLFLVGLSGVGELLLDAAPGASRIPGAELLVAFAAVTPALVGRFGAVIGHSLAVTVGYLAANVTILDSYPQSWAFHAPLAVPVGFAVAYLSYRTPTRDSIRRHRWVMGWWWDRPRALVVAGAVEELAARGRDPWPAVARWIETRVEAERSPEDIARSLDGNWPARIAAAVELEWSGGQVVAAVAPRYRRWIRRVQLGERVPGCRIVEQHLSDLERRTRHLSIRLRRMLCARCFVRPLILWNPLGIAFLDWSFQGTRWYVGCPVCGGADRLVDHAGPIVALLDEDEERDEHAWRERGRVVVSWLRHRRLFEFDRVEIRSARDADVEAFVIQVANEDDRRLRSRVRSARCDVRCPITDNTREALVRTFPVEVTIRPVDAGSMP